MFTLSDASYETRQILKWGGIIIAAIVVLLLIFRVFLIIKNIVAPSPPPKPEVAFGKLQPQSFPQNATGQTLTYNLYTLSGSLPNFPDQVKVYKMQPVRPDLLAVNTFEGKATSIGFLAGSKAISDNLFQWQSDPNLPGLKRTISFNVVNHDFTITSDYMSDPDVLAANNLPGQTQAISMATDMLTNMQELSDDLDQSKTKANLFSIQNNSLSTASSLSDAQIVEVDFYQQDVNQLPIYYENPNSSNISILIAGGTNQAQIVGARYIHQQVSNQGFTYPIKTAQQAYDDLKKQKAYIAAYSGQSAKITITNVFLAYYIGSQSQDFLMPIFVFQGNEGFYAYVPAVTDEWINM